MTLERKEEHHSERLYSFQNFYFAGIHAGIQTAHTIARMSQKYACPNIGMADYPEHIERAHETFGNWAKRGGGETIIVKNGGMAGDLRDLKRFLESEEHPYPFDFFNESYYAADGCLTNVSIVVSERLWQLADAIRRGEDVVYTSETRQHYAFYNTVEESWSPMSNGQPVIHDAYVISRRENMKRAGAPGLFPNEEMLVYTDFDMQLIDRMNRCGLM